MHLFQLNTSLGALLTLSQFATPSTQLLGTYSTSHLVSDTGTRDTPMVVVICRCAPVRENLMAFVVRFVKTWSALLRHVTSKSESNCKSVHISICYQWCAFDALHNILLYRQLQWDWLSGAQHLIPHFHDIFIFPVDKYCQPSWGITTNR